MSLKSFHRVFIVLCLSLTAFTAYWASGQNPVGLVTPWLVYASAAGAAATSDSPVAWLRMEPAPDSEGYPMELRLTLWPEGKARVLATVHPHGAWVNWL